MRRNVISISDFVTQEAMEFVAAVEIAKTKE